MMLRLTYVKWLQTKPTSFVWQPWKSWRWVIYKASESFLFCMISIHKKNNHSSYKENGWYKNGKFSLKWDTGWNPSFINHRNTQLFWKYIPMIYNRRIGTCVGREKQLMLQIELHDASKIVEASLTTWSHVAANERSSYGCILLCSWDN